MKTWFPLLLAMALTAQARIGETDQELATRYGSSVKTEGSLVPGMTMWTYHFKGITVVVGMLDGKSAYESYQKENKAPFDEKERTLLLEANSGGKPWEINGDNALSLLKWTSAGGALIAQWDYWHNAPLVIMTRDVVTLLDNEDTRKKREGLKGF